MVSLSKDLGKRLHVHVDQLNTAKEKTELLARSAINNYYEKVTAVHSISLAAHNKKDYKYGLLHIP